MIIGDRDDSFERLFHLSSDKCKAQNFRETGEKKGKKTRRKKGIDAAVVNALLERRGG